MSPVATNFKDGDDAGDGTPGSLNVGPHAAHHNALGTLANSLESGDFPVFDAKGDLVAAAGGDSGDRLPVGPTGSALTADPAQPLGLRWAGPRWARYEFPNPNNSLDVPVDGDASDLIVVTFEYLLSAFNASVYLRPNANAATIVNGEHTASFTAAPEAAGHAITAQAGVPGLRISGGAGSAGKIVASGRAVIGSHRHASRRNAQVSTVFSNTIGSSNHYTTDWRNTCVFDDATYGAITSLRFITSTGNFEGGTCIVEEIGRD